jgi:glycosyltransferase involved in cell wall biosynthesis
VAALRARAGDGAAIVATVASLTRKKGHEFLLRAIATLAGRGMVCPVLLAGDGSERTSLEALAATLGITESVHFLGAVSDAVDVMAAADVVVLPSLAEGLPLALLEAMQAGRAVVATAVGGVPEVIQSEVNGILVPPADASALADAVSRLVASPQLRARMGAEARRTVARDYTEAAYLASLDAIYSEAVDGRTR